MCLKSKGVIKLDLRLHFNLFPPSV
jgi:hypothetical protein